MSTAQTAIEPDNGVQKAYAQFQAESVSRKGDDLRAMVTSAQLPDPVKQRLLTNLNTRLATLTDPAKLDALRASLQGQIIVEQGLVEAKGANSEETPQQRVTRLWSEIADEENKKRDVWAKAVANGDLTQKEVDGLESEWTRIKAMSPTDPQRAIRLQAYLDKSDALARQAKEHALREGRPQDFQLYQTGIIEPDMKERKDAAAIRTADWDIGPASPANKPTPPKLTTATPDTELQTLNRELGLGMISKEAYAQLKAAHEKALATATPAAELQELGRELSSGMISKQAYEQLKAVYEAALKAGPQQPGQPLQQGANIHNGQSGQLSTTTGLPQKTAAVTPAKSSGAVLG